MNNHLRTITIAPMTSQGKSYPSRIKVKLNKKTGWIVLDQIRTIDKLRIIKIVGRLSLEEITQCKSIIREMFVD